MNITPNDPAVSSRRGRRSPPSMAAAAAGGLLGCALLVLAAPRLIAGLLAADTQTVVWEMTAGQTPAPERLAEAAAALLAAGRWEPSAERETQRGLLLFRLAEATPPGPERARLLTEAAAAYELGLSLGPVQPFAWAAVAALREHAGDVLGAVRAMRMSLLAGAYEPALMKSRLTLGVRLAPWMDEETLDLLRRQIRKLWVDDSAWVAALGATKEGGPLVRRALEDLSEAEIADYVRRYKRP